jgi:hypothetical protein
MTRACVASQMVSPNGVGRRAATASRSCTSLRRRLLSVSTKCSGIAATRSWGEGGGAKCAGNLE